MTGIAIAARNVSRSFGHYHALRDVTLEVNQGEFVSLVGPSGCGKTTLLRILGGFDQPTSGNVMLSGRHVTDVPPERRPTNMVFQRGALFPHMTVAENIAYPLVRKKVGTAEIANRVDEMLALIRLAGFGARSTSELSGGQAQRVALARALVSRPDVLLLDEPFSALDLALKKELQLELKRIHREFACAFVFVTHDQEEALVLSDRIAIMNHGEILQHGSPMSIYREPTDVFAATFIGEMNILPGIVSDVRADALAVRIGSRLIDIARTEREVEVGEKLLVTIRPENITVERAASEGPNGTVDEVIYVGNRWRVRVTCPLMSMPVWVDVPSTSSLGTMRRGDPVSLAFNPEHSRVLAAN